MAVLPNLAFPACDSSCVAPTNVSLQLHELLCAHPSPLHSPTRPGDAAPVILDAACVSQGGFATDEALLPWPARSFSGFRLLTEFFAFPEKFRFIDVAGMEAKTMLGAGNRLEIFFYLDRAVPELERAISAETLALGCVPVVNLFTHECDPVKLDHLQTEYRVEPAERRPGALEIWSIERVRETTGDGTFRAWAPFRPPHGRCRQGRSPCRILPGPAPCLANPVRYRCVPCTVRSGLRRNGTGR